MLYGKPLIASSVRAALDSNLITRTIISSDSKEIIEAAVAEGAEAPFIRPAEFSADESSGVDPVLHALKWLAENEGYHPEWVMLLQPTSPLRTSHDIDDAIEKCIAAKASCLMGVTKSPVNPYWLRRTDRDGYLEDYKIDPAYEDDPPLLVNGALYLVRTADLLRTGSLTPDAPLGYEMPVESSVDIDEVEQFLAAEEILRLRENSHERE